ncbi:amino acid/amide ABC transporter substrate-binding protein (HAAT family) [Roseiarcus fermentans]|uniref:Amino acid/amide ABC transporter substrate-binding protein (HAAT family) n=1 Tax=Roseiarcus fermentans TaxID=1473586 RepID=A0A366EK62_9HYPH|nr:ABC transporter substrate-binding protein [Roseiarcus fermentans]RBP02812.1 amino acid/amide ABC transporter substrate-binding protein (HAAT family) [Roseiarcus fermentans]
MTARTSTLCVALAALLAASPALADDNSVTIGMILPMTGPSASTGKQEKAGAELYLQQHGDTVAGKTIVLAVKDDTGAADVTKRLAQDLVANDHAAALMGFGLTPLALAAAPIATEAKVPEIVTAAATASITEKSPFIVRTSFTLPQASAPMAQWALNNGVKKVVTIVTDYGPGVDAEKWFGETFEKGGGTIVERIRAPLKNPDFAPFLQRVADDKPDAVFVFVPSGFGSVFMKQFVERGLDKAGVKLIGTGDVTDDDQLADIGDAALGAVTAHHYSAAHDSPENKAFVAAFEKANAGMRPNFMAVAAYDGMDLVYRALEKTKGDASGPALLAAMKGMSWTSPRGPVSIDPETRDIVQNIYVRKVEKTDGALYNVEFATIPDVKDPYKAGKH